jgi:hypothetical protein
MSNATLYDQDFHAWANEQAALLRAGRLSEAGIAHIAEEIESMGRSEKRELVNRLAVLLTHLLKWQHQPGHRGNSWRLAIEEQRERLIPIGIKIHSLNIYADWYARRVGGRSCRRFRQRKALLERQRRERRAKQRLIPIISLIIPASKRHFLNRWRPPTVLPALERPVKPAWNARFFLRSAHGRLSRSWTRISDPARFDFVIIVPPRRIFRDLAADQ